MRYIHIKKNVSLTVETGTLQQQQIEAIYGI